MLAITWQGTPGHCQLCLPSSPPQPALLRPHILQANTRLRHIKWPVQELRPGMAQRLHRVPRPQHRAALGINGKAEGGRHCCPVGCVLCEVADVARRQGGAVQQGGDFEHGLAPGGCERWG